MKTKLAKKPREVAMDTAMDPQKQKKCRIHLQYADIEECLLCLHVRYADRANFFNAFLSEKEKCLLWSVIVLFYGVHKQIPSTFRFL